MEKSEVSLSADEALAAQTQSKEQDTLIAGKFKTVDELVSAYEELSGKPEVTPDEDPAEETGSTPGDSEGSEEGNADAAAREAAESAGFDWKGLNDEYAENGELSEDTYSRLEKSGIPREMVDTYIRGKQAESAEYDSAVYEAAGSKDTYASMLGWAKSNLTDSEKTKFNEAVSSGDREKAVAATAELSKRYVASRGQPPKETLRGNSRTSTGPTPFQSVREVTEAMNNPKYRSDSAYRASVVERLRVSTVI